MLTPQDLVILKRPFAPHEMEWREEERTKKNGEKFQLVLAYIAEEAICDRLEMVDPSWQFSDIQIAERGGQVYAIASMTVKGVTRSNVGMEEIKHLAEAEKSAATDSLKRCARLFGIGRYLLNLPKWANSRDGYAKWFAQNKDKNADSIDSEQPEPEPAPAPVVDRGNLPIVESPFKNVKKSEPAIDDHFEPTDFATQVTESFSEPIEKVTIKTTNKGKTYFVLAGCSIWDTGIFEKLGYDEYTLNQMTKPGSVMLPDPVRVAYMPEGKDRKYPEALRVFRPVNQAKVVLKEQNAA
jgi:hypothetical protein